MLRLSVDPAAPDPASLARIADIIRADGVVAVPTDTFYGLAVNPFSAAAIDRAFAVKDRPADRALPLVASDLDQLTICLGPLPLAGQALAARYWPGPLTLLIPRPPTLPSTLTGGLEAVGVRVPAHPVARALCRACGMPLTATSANLSGRPPSADPDEIAQTLGPRLDALLDAGFTPGGAASTIVDVTGPRPRLVRAGAVSWDEIAQCVARA